MLLFVIGGSGGAFAADDPFFAQQWGLHRIDAERAWAPAADGSGVVVAVIDTGVNFAHEDLAGKSAGEINTIARPRGDCDSAPGDNQGHGTQVAGIIAAGSNNGRGIASVAPGSMILSVKALDCKGEGYISDVSRGIREAARRGAKVINLSLGHEVGLVGAVLNIIGQDESRDFQAAINEAAGAGALVVAAAGNDSLQSSYAGMENVLVVGASGPDDEHSEYSSSGAEVMAPGGNALGGCGGQQHRCVATTERGGGYAAVQGTSFSAPHVSGVAALLSRQGHGPGSARSVMLSSADPVPAGPRINAARAVGAPPPAGVQGDASGAAAGDGSRSVRAAGTGSQSGIAQAQSKSSAKPGAPPGIPGAASPGSAPPAGTLILGAPQGAPPEVSRAITGGAEGSGSGGRAARPVRGEADGGSPVRNLSLAALVTVAAGGAAMVVWKRRQLF